jgi:Reverse transcriptase (RNA-dependent DNA polymerase)
VVSAINHLNPNKSAGPDGILAGMLKNSTEQTLPFIVELFNSVFDSGDYPSVWTGAIVVPIHKSGDVDNPDNYRGISLLSILGKVFATILNKRLAGWASDNNKIDEVQSGFRAGYSTIDNIFVLYSIVQKYLLKRSGKLYVCFVDFRKAFDCVNRAILWNTLRKAGVGGKMLKILQSMYKSVRSCVRCPSNITDFFECPIGVRQGCVLSPTLFSFLINELAREVSEKGMHGVQLTPDIFQILILLFADDVALTSFSVLGLQKQINILKNFADNFGMSVNLSKTKIIVFRKGGFLAKNEHWNYGNELIEVVNSYKYLGLHFTTKLSLSNAVSELAVKAKVRTMQILRCLFRLGDIRSNIFFKIFDAQVVPVMLYGAEIWGFHTFGDIEKVHLFACKRLLRVGQQTPNKLVYGDLGRFPLFVNATIRMVKYWLRLITMPHARLPRKAYSMSCVLCDSGKKSWAFHLKNILFENGFTEAWLQQSVGDIRVFLKTLRERLIDRFQSEWQNDILTKDRYEFYALFKRTFNLKAENYVDCNQLRCFKIAYVQFRFGISPINCHRLRYKRNVTAQQLLCPVCKNDKEDEKHILLFCVAYEEFRSDLAMFIDNDRSMDAIMSADDDESVAEISNFLYKVFKKRAQFIP